VSGVKSAQLLPTHLFRQGGGCLPGPLDFLAEVTPHTPDPGAHLVRYYGWHSNHFLLSWRCLVSTLLINADTRIHGG
jgi:hypothetical protein